MVCQKAALEFDQIQIFALQEHVARPDRLFDLNLLSLRSTDSKILKEEVY